MRYSEYKEQARNSSALKRVDILGHFDFNLMIVSLDSVTTEDVQELWRKFGEDMSLSAKGNLSPEQYAAAAKVFPVAVHEYTHFLDSTSTLWGLKHLALMNRAYLANGNRGAPVASYPWAKVFSDHCRSIRLPDYYTVVNESVNNTPLAWRSELTLGHLFENDGKPSRRPILFSRFANRDGELLARSPVSTVSLLEASAMAQEWLFHGLLISQTPPDFRLVETRHFQEESIRYLYRPDITEYSVCAHVAANMQGCKDASDAFRVCSALIRHVLNLPESMFATLAKTCPIAEILELPPNHSCVSRMRSGLEFGDMGIVFYLLCSSLPKGSFESPENVTLGIEKALNVMGIDRNILIAEQEAEADKLLGEMSGSGLSSIVSLSQAGYSNFKRLHAKEGTDFFELSLPPAMLGDLEVAQLFYNTKNELRTFDINASFDELCEGYKWVNAFAGACV